MLICHHRHQPVIYATWAQTNSQIILLFLSLNEEETQALDVIRIRCEMGICVNQCGAAVGAAKARGGVTHHPAGEAPAYDDVDVYTAEQLVSSPHCVVMRIWWDSLSAEHQEPLGLGVCVLWAEPFRCATPPSLRGFHCRWCVGRSHTITLPWLSYVWELVHAQPLWNAKKNILA